MRNHTGLVPIQLSGPNGQNATWAVNGNIRFLLNNLPLTISGNLCAYLLGVLITATIVIPEDGPNSENLVSPLTLSGEGVVHEDFERFLWNSLEVRNCWHGTPVSSNTHKGAIAGLIEWLSGYSYFGRRMEVIKSGIAPAGRVIRVSSFIPLSSLMGEKSHHTALPTVFYKGGEVVLNCGPGPGLDMAGSEGSPDYPSWTTATIQASAIVLAEPELRVGPSSQWIDYTANATGGGSIVTLDSLGNASTVTGLQPGAGLAFLGWLSERYSQAGWQGAGAVASIRRFDVPFRGIQQSEHPDAMLRCFEAAATVNADAPCARTFAALTSLFGSSGSYGRLPHAPMAGPTETAAGSRIDDALFFPLVYAGRDLELSKLQTVNGTQAVSLEFATDDLPSGTHHFLAHQFGAWSPERWASAKQLFLDSGLCRAVLGTNDNLAWAAKLSKKNADPSAIDPAKARYLPLRLTVGAGGA